MKPADVEHGFGTFPDRGLQLADGEGSTVTTSDGQRMLDAGGASYGTANVGHAHPRIQAALAEAHEGLLHTSRTFSHPERARLVDELRAFAGDWSHRVFLSNSGTEAVEAAIKTALATTEGSRLVAFEDAFHGRTLGSLAATHKPAYREPFAERLGDTTFVPYGDEQALQDALDDDVAAVLVEPVQGEAGVRLPPPGFLQAVVDEAHEVDALAIVDEVQTGLGRTGAPLAIHNEGVEPDLVCLAKSLAAGLPLGATIAHERVPTLEPGQHGTTFGGSPPACRVAREVLAILADERLAQRARRIGVELTERITELDHTLVADVRGRGLMIGIGLRVRPTPVLRALQTEGVLALPGGDGLRLLPPLVLTDEQADEILHALSTALDTVQDRYARRSTA